MAATPIVLFYALTQGAFALCAAKVVGDPWEAYPAHGLNLLKPDRGGGTPSLSEIYVQEKDKGFVHQVAKLLHSPVLTKEASLGEVLCALPEHFKFFLLNGYENLRRPLIVKDTTLTLPHTAEPSSDVEAAVGPMPPQLLRRESTTSRAPGMVPPTIDKVVSWFGPYPTLERAGPPSAVGDVNPMELTRDPNYHVRVRWKLPQPIEWGTSNLWLRSIVDILDYDQPGAAAKGTVLPAIGGNSEAQHPLVTWWIVLYTCSMLARYYPRTWVDLLDVDKSLSAVPLDRLLHVAHDRLPGLLLDAIVDSQ